MKDLWPSEIGYAEGKAPVTILKEQASLLGAKTENMIKAEVSYIKGSSFMDQNGFAYDFTILAPLLEDYRYRLFTIKHDVELYPLKIYTDDEILGEISPAEKDKIVINSEAELLEALKKILNSKKAKRIISAMLLQCRKV